MKYPNIFMWLMVLLYVTSVSTSFELYRDVPCSSDIDLERVIRIQDPTEIHVPVGDAVRLSCGALRASPFFGYNAIATPSLTRTVCWLRRTLQGIQLLTQTAPQHRTVVSYVVEAEGYLHFANTQPVDRGLYDCFVSFLQDNKTIATFGSRTILDVLDCSAGRNPCKSGKCFLDKVEEGFKFVNCTCSIQFTGRYCTQMKEGEGAQKEWRVYSPIVAYAFLALLVVGANKVGFRAWKLKEQ